MTIRIFADALLLFFAVIGFIELCIRAIEYFFLRKYLFEDIFIVVPMKGDRDSAEHVIRLLLAQTEEILTKRGRPEIMIVDLGMDGEALEICDKMEAEFDSVAVYAKEDLFERIKNRFSQGIENKPPR